MNYNKKSIEDIDVAGKRVLCRCDFNVPTKNGAPATMRTNSPFGGVSVYFVRASPSVVRTTSS